MRSSQRFRQCPTRGPEMTDWLAIQKIARWEARGSAWRRSLQARGRIVVDHHRHVSESQVSGKYLSLGLSLH
jgi:hypothetical protein